MFSKFRRIGSRKVSVKTAVLVVALVLFAVTAIAARYEVLTVGTLQVDSIERLSSNHTLDIAYQGPLTKTDSSGNIERYEALDAIQVVNYDDLTSWTSDAGTSGMSIFFASPGVRYVFDMLDIYYRLFPGATCPSGWSGVTVVAPQASSANNGKTFSVEWGTPQSGNTVTLTAAHSGSTIIYVVPWSSLDGSTTATTSYNTAGQTAQTMLGISASNLGSGVSEGFIDSVGESATFRLNYNTGVSVEPIEYVSK